MTQPIKGFSKLTKEAKIEWITDQYFHNREESGALLRHYWHPQAEVQKLHDEFIENTISNFYTPYGVAPNFKIDGQLFAIPMAIEESSVVAAAAKSASFWLKRGGFKTEIISTTKIGHVHFIYQGTADKLRKLIEEEQAAFYQDTESITANMRARGGGILDLKLVDKTADLEGYYQLEARFETCDSMGANFINSCLEQFSKTLERLLQEKASFSEAESQIQVIMSILSNYTPECLVRSEVSCPVEDLEDGSGIDPEEFAQKFQQAVRIAEIEPYRATTHNKGIMNGIDAVVMATGNDFRAIEAACHTYASRSGRYQSLTHCRVEEGQFRFWIEVPLALGTVGGLTSLHPMVKFSLDLLQQPQARQLMGIIASSGLAQNFAALRALTTTGIQKGHMKMHLLNILNQLEATEAEKATVVDYFKDKVVSHSAAVQKFCELRGIQSPADIGKKV
ncbi:MAG: hydroxymethylglutaryl-CoA reductase, degradative [Schleiferiaceae bacterium]|nr:hydroxymethylglutaryl-CoA reductase, degradative [Schleiferiaceae bacterium]MDR9442398.1 hydroxymethylglutaryl-CoA reductase, degradative [Schleiferiaceae bacterium]